VSEDGTIENRIIDLPPGLPSSALVEASNYLSDRIRGKTIAELRVELEQAKKMPSANLIHLRLILFQRALRIGQVRLRIGN